MNGEKDMFELMLDRRSAAEAGKEKEFEWGMFSVEVCPHAPAPLPAIAISCVRSGNEHCYTSWQLTV